MTFPIIPAGSPSGNYQVKNSLRFRRSAVGNLTRTFGTPTTQNTFSYSCWTKRGLLSTLQIFFGYSNLNSVYFTATDTIALTNGSTTLQSTAVYRDPSAWYHILYTQSGTTANIYVNGTLAVTGTCSVSFNTASVAHCIGSYSPASSSYDGYIAEIYFIDGQVKAVSDFTSIDATTGVRVAAKYTGTYGNNGFYLPFSLNTTSTYAGSFNGSTQLLSVADNAVFTMGSGSFTIEAWVNFTGSGRQIVVSKGDAVGTTNSYSFQLERDASGFLTFYIFSGTTVYTASGTTLIPTGQWVHIAGVRNGNNIICYLNGIQQATASVTGVTINSSANPVQISGYGGGSATGFLVNGSISNVRIVKGTAVYTANFTPSSQALTAVSGTSLLCLQSSSVTQDNSGNSLTITNVGTVTTSTATPFVANITSDNSSNANNWTSNNINYTSSGTTYDAMIDAPNIYASSATQGAGNYATLNPLDNPSAYFVNATFSAANLNIAATSGGQYYVHPTISNNTGKFYHEFTATSLGAGGALTNSIVISAPGNPGAVYCAYDKSGQKYVSGAWTTGWTAWSANDVIGIAVDYDAGSATYYLNGTLQGTLTFGSQGSAPLCVANNAQAGSGGTVSVSFNAGQRPFSISSVPSGFKSLNTSNLPTPTIANGAQYMAATLYTGNGGTLSPSNGTSSGNNPLGATFQPDFVWLKDRSFAYNHAFYDVVRGVQKWLSSSTTDAENTYGTGELTAFNSNGFTLVNSANYQNNKSSDTYVAWQWKAGGTGVSNTSGSITSTVSANASAGFSVVTYTGTGANATVGHGLGVAPNMVIVKSRTNGTYGWQVGHIGMTSWAYTMNLQAISAQSSNPGAFNSAAPTSSVFSLGNNADTNGSALTFVAYCFAPVTGYSAFGSYTGNGSADGPFIYTGFRPRWLLAKVSSGTTGNWELFDSSRNPYNQMDLLLLPSSANAESGAYGSYYVDFTANGFKIRGSGGGFNGSGETIIYAAFAENPFKYSNAR